MDLLIGDPFERAGIGAAPGAVVGHARGGKLIALNHRIIGGGVGIRAGSQMQLAVVQRAGQRAAANAGDGFAGLLELQIIQTGGG